MKKAIIAIVVLLNLVLITLGVLFFMGIIPSGSSPAGSAEGAIEAPAVVEFYELNPPIVVNVLDGRKLRFMQTEMTFLIRESGATDVLDKYDPMIRHELIVYMSNFDGAAFKTTEGKKTLQDGCLEIVNSILKREKTDVKIAQVLFTKMIMQ